MTKLKHNTCQVFTTKTPSLNSTFFLFFIFTTYKNIKKHTIHILERDNPNLLWFAGLKPL